MGIGNCISEVRVGVLQVFEEKWKMWQENIFLGNPETMGHKVWGISDLECKSRLSS